MSRVERLRTISILLLGSLWLPAAALGQQRRSPVAPGRERVEVVVREAYDKFRSDTNGKNADYIPYLAQVDPKLFGVSIVTTDNQVVNVGDVNYVHNLVVGDRKSTRLNSSHTVISYAVFCLKKKKNSEQFRPI